MCVCLFIYFTAGTVDGGMILLEFAFLSHSSRSHGVYHTPLVAMGFITPLVAMGFITLLVAMGFITLLS